MKKAICLLIALGVLISLSSLCTKVAFDNPLDAKGTNYAGDSLVADHDNDGVPNIYDEDYLKEKDKTAPVILFTGGLGNGDTVILRLGDPDQVLAKVGVKATDNLVDSVTITARIQKPDIFTSLCGIQSVVYTVKDLAENSTSRTRIIIVDCDLPVITLVGDNPMNLRVGATYTEPGVNATDNIDGPIPAANITRSATTVNTSTAHVDSIVYTCKDRAGNPGTKTRKIVVSEVPDTDPPVITLKGDSPLSIKEGTPYPYTEPWCTAIDNIDGDISSKVVVTGGPVSTTLPGRDTLVYNVSDKAGNPAVTVSRIVVITPIGPVVDTIKPEITLKGSAASIPNPAGSPRTMSTVT
jgi:hypothetical protein